jgi:hypothetical protein
VIPLRNDAHIWFNLVFYIPQFEFICLADPVDQAYVRKYLDSLMADSDLELHNSNSFLQ